jgi:hypothetical protein
LHKDDHSVACDIYTHPLGGELRCDVDGELFAVHASWNLDELLGASQRWKASFEEAGWGVGDRGGGCRRVDMGTSAPHAPDTPLRTD